MTQTQRGAYRFELREWYVSYVDIDANTEAEALAKLHSFYRKHRHPEIEFRLDGVHVILDDQSVRFVRRRRAYSTTKATSVETRSIWRGAKQRNATETGKGSN